MLIRFVEEYSRPPVWKRFVTLFPAALFRQGLTKVVEMTNRIDSKILPPRTRSPAPVPRPRMRARLFLPAGSPAPKCEPSPRRGEKSEQQLPAKGNRDVRRA